jgi:hypothetical protein
LGDDSTCALWHDEYFPAICRAWPVHPNDVKQIPDCSFTFRKILP